MATSRRGHGEGSVFYDKSRDRWVAMLDLGRDANGKRRRVWRSAKSKADAAAILRALQATADRGDDPRGAKRTVVDVLEDFREHGIDQRRAGATRYKLLRYAQSFADAMRSRPIRDVTVRHAEQWLTALATAGEKGNSYRTLVEARGAAAQLFDHAIRQGWVPPERNPLRLARIPESRPTPPRPVLADQDVQRLLAAAEGDWWHPMLAFIAVTGVRVGEAAGLAWSDIDTANGSAVIRRAVRIEPNGPLTFTTPKSNSTRVISLPPELVDVVKAHRARVAERALARGTTAPDLAFPTTVGTAPDPNGLRRWFRGVAKRANVTIRGFHDLRHAVASSLADDGVAPIRVAALLGHANPRTTLGVYTHPVTPNADAGIERGSRLLGEAAR